MKKILFTLLALALLPVFAFAQDGCPTPASATATITFKRRSADPVFSVSGTTKVQFSQGNLQYQASTNTWRFAEHQYDMIGADNSNISSSYTGWIDLFGWATSGNSETGTNYQPYSTGVSNYEYGNNSQPSSGEWNAAKSDWGQNMSPADYWRTLSSAEWTYLLNTRTTTATIEGVSNARFMRAKILTDGNIGIDGVNYNILGLILFPDNYSGDKPEGVTWSDANVNTYAWNFVGSCTCTTAGWAALEAAGCVFLPCAGYRDGTTITNIGTEGFYWSSTASSGENANCLYFATNSPIHNKARHLGHSVRLVHVVE